MAHRGWKGDPLYDVRKLLGFHHRRVESFTRKVRSFCARSPSERAMRRARERTRSHTDRRLLMLDVEYIVDA